VGDHVRVLVSQHLQRSLLLTGNDSSSGSNAAVQWSQIEKQAL
jgi:hypothetical protein